MTYKAGAMAAYCVLAALAPFSNAQTALPGDQALPAAPCERPAWTEDAFQARDFGTFKVRLMVDDNGKVLNAKVLVSTQSRSLDRAGLAKVSGCKFVPQYDAAGKPEWMGYSFSWPYSELPPEPPAPPAPPATAMTAEKDCKKPEYPLASLRNEETGTVTMKFLIDVDGKVVDKRIKRSSGFPMLDYAALTAIAKCAFKPARHNGMPVKEWTDVQYVWSLE
ncbi:TonB family protein [Massilia sp. B-10]|nr:TonB family protein [Massilia sp. B-10]UUZ54565.1 TonB family protein [Massilia sp. H-1]